MNTYTKFCKDCAHMIAPMHGLKVADYARCGFGLIAHPVTGELDMPTQSMRYCCSLRQSSDAQNCGPDARFFKPKEDT